MCNQKKYSLDHTKSRKDLTEIKRYDEKRKEREQMKRRREGWGINRNSKDREKKKVLEAF